MLKKLFIWIYKTLKFIIELFVLMPLKNGNGKVLNTEFASYTTVWVVFYAIISEAIKEGQQYTDVQFIAIVGLLAGIIGIKEYFNSNKLKNND